MCLCSKCTYEKKTFELWIVLFFPFFFFFFWYSLVVESLLFLFEIFFCTGKTKFEHFFWPSNIAGFLLHELRRKLIKFDHKIDRLIDCDFVYINLIESQSSDYYYYYHRSIINIDIRHWEMSMCHIY